jgi:hypothetical protein
VRTDGAEGDHLDALLHERADRRDLLLLLAVGVGEFEVDVGGFGRILDGRRVGRPPPALGAHLGEAHGELTAGGRLAARRLSATARRQHTYRRDGHHRS